MLEDTDPFLWLRSGRYNLYKNLDHLRAFLQKEPVHHLESYLL